MGEWDADNAGMAHIQFCHYPFYKFATSQRVVELRLPISSRQDFKLGRHTAS